MEETPITPKEYVKKLYKFYHSKNGKIPDFEWIYSAITKKIPISKEKVQELIPLVEAELFPEKVTTEFLERELRTNLERIKSSFRKPIEKTSQFVSSIHGSGSINSLRYVLLFIGLGAVYMSIFYSYEWLCDFLSPWRALLLSSIMISFAVSAFELILLFKQKKNYFLIGIFSVLWVVVTTFSMISTVAGQYNARIASLNRQYEQDSKLEQKNKQERNLIEQKSLLMDKLKSAEQDKERIYKLIAEFSSVEKIEENNWRYNNLQYQFNKAKSDIDKISKELDTIREKEKGVESVKKSPPDFYLWISSLFGWNPEMIQFWMSIFPAIFIDLVSPISIAVFIFVRDEKKE